MVLYSLFLFIVFIPFCVIFSIFFLRNSWVLIGVFSLVLCLLTQLEDIGAVNPEEPKAVEVETTEKMDEGHFRISIQFMLNSYCLFVMCFLEVFFLSWGDRNFGC